MASESANENQEKNDFEARQNLLEAFSVLLKVDKRINPHLYTKDENNRSSNNPDDQRSS